MIRPPRFTPTGPIGSLSLGELARWRESDPATYHAAMGARTRNGGNPLTLARRYHCRRPGFAYECKRCGSYLVPSMIEEHTRRGC